MLICVSGSPYQVVVIEETTTVDEEIVEDPPLPAVQEEPEATPPPQEEATPKVSRSKARQSPLSPARVQRLHEKEELQVRSTVSLCFGRSLPAPSDDTIRG